MSIGWLSIDGLAQRHREDDLDSLEPAPERGVTRVGVPLVGARVTAFSDDALDSSAADAATREGPPEPLRYRSGPPHAGGPASIPVQNPTELPLGLLDPIVFERLAARNSFNVPTTGECSSMGGTRPEAVRTGCGSPRGEWLRHTLPTASPPGSRAVGQFATQSRATRVRHVHSSGSASPGGFRPVASFSLPLLTSSTTRRTWTSLPSFDGSTPATLRLRYGEQKRSAGDCVTLLGSSMPSLVHRGLRHGVALPRPRRPAYLRHWALWRIPSRY